MSKQTNKKPQFVFLVYCNVEPIIYAVYSTEKRAIDYAKSLIEYRKEQAEKRGYKFSFYHYMEPYDFDYYRNDKGQLKKYIRVGLDSIGQMRFSACLNIKEDKANFSNHGCFIQVEKRLVI